MHAAHVLLSVDWIKRILLKEKKTIHIYQGKGTILQSHNTIREGHKLSGTVQSDCIHDYRLIRQTNINTIYFELKTMGYKPGKEEILSKRKWQQ